MVISALTLTLFAVGLKIYVKWWGGEGVHHHPFLTPKITVKNQFFFCFSDRSYRNRKSHKIWVYLEAILRVLELIFNYG